jgi:probable H4MPT-linked C1 transfer pathway protein
MTAPVLGLDVGGANLKAADGCGRAVSVPFPVWQRRGDLPGALAGLLATFPPAGRLAVTMTAELCDCFATRAEGVRAVLSAVAAAAPGLPVRVWGTDGRFHEPGSLLRSDPLLAAASNWLATATLAARLVPSGPGLFLDIGSTTADIIPLCNNNIAHARRTDLDRLRTGELVYVGVRRTPLFALGPEAPWRGGTVGLAAERFATTHDLYLALGDLPEAPEDRDTADGRPATRACALGRIARMVGADRDTLDEGAILDLARALDRLLLERLVTAARRVHVGDAPPTVVLAGSGAFLAARLARALQPDPSRILDLGKLWGADASHAAAAHAVAILGTEDATGVASQAGASAPGGVSPLSPPRPHEGGGGRIEPSPLVGEGGRAAAGRGGGVSPPAPPGGTGPEGKALAAPPNSPSRPTTILKLGGSLLDWPGLAAALVAIAEEHRDARAVLVVGGGAIVDRLRDLDRLHALGDRPAHELAIRALDLTAHVAAALAPSLLVAVATPDALPAAWASGRLPVLPPRGVLDPDDPALPPSWEVTSDALAAALAIRLGADRLVLLKSAPPPPALATHADAARLGLVDPAFPGVARAIPIVLYRKLRPPDTPTVPLVPG